MTKSLSSFYSVLWINQSNTGISKAKKKKPSGGMFIRQPNPPLFAHKPPESIPITPRHIKNKAALQRIIRSRSMAPCFSLFGLFMFKNLRQTGHSGISSLASIKRNVAFTFSISPGAIARKYHLDVAMSPYASIIRWSSLVEPSSYFIVTMTGNAA